MATQADLVTRALSLCQVIQSGQTPATTDYNLVDGMVAGKLDELRARDIYTVADPDDIPDGALQWLGMLLAQDVITDFGGTIDAGAIQLAEQRLKSLKPIDLGGTGGDSTGTVRACYF